MVAPASALLPHAAQSCHHVLKSRACTHSQAFFTGDPAGRTARSGYPMFMIHFANKGSSWCLTNAAEAGGAAKLRPCDGSDSQLWFVPQW